LANEDVFGDDDLQSGLSVAKERTIERSAHENCNPSRIITAAESAVKTQQHTTHRDDQVITLEREHFFNFKRGKANRQLLYQKKFWEEETVSVQFCCWNIRAMIRYLQADIGRWSRWTIIIMSKL